MAGLHPTLDRFQTLQDAVLLGIGPELEKGGLRGGEVQVTFDPASDIDPVTSFRLLDYRNEKDI